MKSGLREKDDGIDAKVRQLEKRDEVRDTRKLEERLAKRHRKYQGEYARFFRRLNADQECGFSLPR